MATPTAGSGLVFDLYLEIYSKKIALVAVLFFVLPYLTSITFSAFEILKPFPEELQFLSDISSA